MENPTITDILVLPLALTFFGMLGYLLARNHRNQYGGSGRGRWVGVVLLVLALFAGLSMVWRIHNPSDGYLYSASINIYGKKLVYSHYVAAALPLICLAVCAFLELGARRYRDEY